MQTKTFWPYGILISLLLVAIACAVTVVIGVKNPVHIDNFYFEKYQFAKENFDKIEIWDKNFKQEFDLEFLAPNLRAYNAGASLLNVEITDIKANRSNLLNFKLTPKDTQKNINDLKFEILLTKPETREFDLNLTPKITQNGFVLDVNPNKIGRWQLMIKIQSSPQSISFTKYELFAN